MSKSPDLLTGGLFLRTIVNCKTFIYNGYNKGQSGRCLFLKGQAFSAWGKSPEREAKSMETIYAIVFLIVATGYIVAVQQSKK